MTLPLDQTRSTAQEVTNLLDVSARTLGHTPSAFIDELCDDVKNRPGQVVSRVADGALIGAGATLLLKIPRVAPIALAAGLLYTGYKALDPTVDFISKASGADTDAQRRAVANTSAHQLGGTLSAMVESTPGMLAGGFGVAKAFGAPPLYTRIGDAVDRSVLAPARESFAFRGPGSLKFTPSLINQSGELDALNASKILSERHPWSGIETGSTIDLGKMRMSRVVRGDASEIGVMPGTTRDNVVPFHIHGPEAKVGFLPSNVDMASTRGLGIIKQGDLTTFYVGQGREYSALAKAGNGESFFPTMKAVVVDTKAGVAQRYTGQWLPGKGVQLDAPVKLDFASTLKSMGKVSVTDPWESLLGIAPKAGG